MAHGIKFDLIPTKYGGKGGMTIEENFFPFEYNDEKLCLKITKPVPGAVLDLTPSSFTCLLPSLSVLNLISLCSVPGHTLFSTDLAPSSSTCLLP